MKFMFSSRDVTPVASQKHFCNEPKQFTAHTPLLIAPANT